jgi:hypothetical protein
MICPKDHKHAINSTCYVLHKCRCAVCREARRVREARRRKDIAYGRYDSGLVDAEPIREHVLMLQSFGLGWKRIAELSGVGYTATETLIYGRKGGNSDPRKGEVIKRMGREKAVKLLAVKPDFSLLADGARVSARGTHRRVQALVARGWSQSQICARLGMERGNFWRVMMQTDQVSVRLHKKTAALYDQLWDQEPPRDGHREKIAYSRTIKYARKRRWLPPLTWDDIDTDLEPPVPDDVGGIDEMAVELACGGDIVRLSTTERREAVTRLAAVKLSDGQIAERLHIADRTVLRIRQELGIAASVGADGQVLAA